MELCVGQSECIFQNENSSDNVLCECVFEVVAIFLTSGQIILCLLRTDPAR